MPTTVPLLLTQKVCAPVCYQVGPVGKISWSLISPDAVCSAVTTQPWDSTTFFSNQQLVQMQLWDTMSTNSANHLSRAMHSHSVCYPTDSKPNHSDLLRTDQYLDAIARNSCIRSIPSPRNVPGTSQFLRDHDDPTVWQSHDMHRLPECYVRYATAYTISIRCNNMMLHASIYTHSRACHRVKVSKHMTTRCPLRTNQPVAYPKPSPA